MSPKCPDKAIRYDLRGQARREGADLNGSNNPQLNVNFEGGNPARLDSCRNI